MRDSIGQRNFVCNEYYKHKIALNEKKNKKLLVDSRLWEVEGAQKAFPELTPDMIRQNPEIARKFLSQEVTL